MATEYPSREISIGKLLTTLLSDENETSDVTLEGTDGGRSNAHRCILAARSEVFRRMLFGQFAETKTAIVRIGFDTTVLQAIIEYCYTDHASLFDDDCCDDSWARGMVRLAVAADYFQFTGLVEKVHDLAESAMDRHPLLAFAFFDETEITAGNAACKLFDTALGVLRLRFRSALLPPASPNVKGVESLYPSSLERLLRDSEISADELTMFRALRQWSGSSDVPADPPEEVRRCKRRLDIASKLVGNICLKRIQPFDLCSIVEPSGFVAPDQLLEAFKDHALSTEAPVPTCRGPCWDTSQDAVLECKEQRVITALLQCKPMRSGVHTWKIEIVKLTDKGVYYDQVGVAHKVQSHNESLSSAKNTAWVYDRRGLAYHAEKEFPVFSTFAKGSIITFTLDLTSSGSLTASVDGNPSVQIFDDILNELKDKEEVSFVPAASVSHMAEIRFLGFKSQA